MDRRKNRNRIILPLVVIVVVAGMAGSLWFARSSPDKAIQFLVNGGLEQERAESFIAWLGGEFHPEEVKALVASGSIEGAEVTVVSEFGGRITELNVDEGDEVAQGQVLVQLDPTALLAQKAQVDAGVEAAQASLEAVRAGRHPGEALVAEAALRQAISERDAAETTWQDMEAILENPQEIGAQIVEAETALALAGTKIEQCKASLATAEVQRDLYADENRLEEKRLYRSLAFQVEAAQAALDAAEAEEKGAQMTLAALRALRDNPLALVSQVHAARSGYKIAAAGVDVAQAKLDELRAGPAPEEVAVAEAQVAQAEAAGALLDVQLAKMSLQAPIDGIVTSRSAHTGEAALAGSTLLTIANLDEVTLTIYVPEDELNRVYLGQEAEVRVDAFPDRIFAGKVSYISQQAEFTPKNVQTEKERVNMVFAIKVRLANPGHLLKPGMPADASLK
jgi:multidrug resistance efflux pump